MKPAISARYTRAAMAFHWSMAILIVIGLTIDDFPRPDLSAWINVHALIGLLIFALCVGRVVWRYRRSPPSLPASYGRLARRSSTAVDWIVYALLLVIPLIGIVAFIWHGRVLKLGFLHIDVGVKADRSVLPTEEVHGYLTGALFTLAGLHILAGSWRQFVGRRGVLSRMWPT